MRHQPKISKIFYTTLLLSLSPTNCHGVVSTALIQNLTLNVNRKMTQIKSLNKKKFTNRMRKVLLLNKLVKIIQ